MSDNRCPSAAELDALISGNLPHSIADRATEHVGSCTQCQESLESTAVGNLTDSGVVSLQDLSIEDLVGKEAVRLPKDSAYWSAVDQAAIDFQELKTSQRDVEVTIPPDNLAADTDSVNNADTTPTIDLPATEPRIPSLPFLKPSEDPAYIGRLNHFEISRIIGRGGMGIVLESFDTHLQRTVAIKVLTPEYSKNEIARKRFCREGRAAAAIAHEHVVAMHQVAREDEGEIAYLVMQFIEGDTLEKRLRDSDSMTPQVAARFGMQIAAGLSAAHQRDMVHRDIKPANILIEQGTERIKLTDFGLARASDDVRLTKTGMVTGTPLYMSPEQATGKAADERSDLFSLGAVLYEMLTGSSPFEAPSIVGVMKRIMDETPTSPAKLNAQIPVPLSELTMALLDKNPQRRPESAALVAETLAEIVTNYGPISPLQAPSIGSSTVRRRTGSHRLVSQNTLRAAWGVGVMGVASLVIGAALFFMASQTPVTEQASTATFPSTVLAGNPGTVWAVDFDPTGELAITAIEDGSVRLWNIAEQKVVKSFNAHRGIVWMIQYHPTRPIVATSGDDGMVKLWDADSLELLQEWQANNSVRKIAFSPDGTRLVAGDRDGVIQIWHIDSGIPLATVNQPGSIFGVDWSADGKLIASVGSDKIVRLWDAETLEQRQTMHGHQGPIYNVRFAASGSRLATVGWGKAIHLWDSATGLAEMQLEGSTSDSWSVAFCGEGDGEHAVVASQDGKCRIWDLSNGKLIATLTGHESAVHNVSLDHSTRRIATSGRDGTVRVWDLSGLAE